MSRLTSPIAWRYALRSLGRHRRRSLLSILGVGLGIAVSLLMIGWVGGEAEMMKQAAADSGVGNLRIAPAAWPATREDTLRLPEAAQTLAALRSDPHVAVAAPHARCQALLAMGTRTTGVEILGVDPAAEPALNRMVRGVTAGRYLRAGDGDACVIGAGVARQLRVEVGDELLVTASGRGDEMRSAMLHVVGVVRTGSTLIDDGLCQAPLQEVENISGYPGPAEITVVLRDPDQLVDFLAAWQPRLPAGAVAVPWQALIPALADGVQIDQSFADVIVGVIVLVVFLGIASAQLAAVLERRREFAVLVAIGMKGRQLVAAMLAEAVLLGLAGAGLGMALGLPLVYRLHAHGFDFRTVAPDFQWGVSNILIDPVIHAAMGWWMLPLAVGLALCATVLGSVYPAYFALSTDPANALRAE
ncbi:MAG: ABC transporter permease [Planctomycetota bacterium]